MRSRLIFGRILLDSDGRIPTFKNHNPSIHKRYVGRGVVENLLIENSIQPIFFPLHQFREIQLAIKFTWKYRFQ